MSITKNVPLINILQRKKNQKSWDTFLCRKLTLKVRILQFSKTFMQVYVKHKNVYWAFNLKEGPVRWRKCATKVGSY